MMKKKKNIEILVNPPSILHLSIPFYVPFKALLKRDLHDNSPTLGYKSIWLKSGEYKQVGFS